MRTIIICLIFSLAWSGCIAGIVEKTYDFRHYSIERKGDYRQITFASTVQSAFIGEPCIPYHKVMLLLPPGESAVAIEVIGEDEIQIPGTFRLFPQQPPQPTDQDPTGEILVNEAVYQLDDNYPSTPSGRLMTQYLNGYAIALCTFTPVKYNPAKGQVSYYQRITVKIHTLPNTNSIEALSGLSGKDGVNRMVAAFVQNPGMMSLYPSAKSPLTDYDYLMISPASLQSGLTPLIDFYTAKGISCQVKTLETISDSVAGYDLQEKIRNYIRNEYLTNHIEYVLLAGNHALLPSRGFYCYVQSGSGYSDNNIPADLYYSGMDGTYDADGDHLYAEESDSTDLLPELSVARFTVNTAAELQNMIHKTISYQSNPVPGEVTRVLLAGEHLWSSPMTFGGPFMDLLVGDHSDYGYFTHGIPLSHPIEKMYDSLTPASSIWKWTASSLIAKLNTGPTCIHHLGHANTTYMMRLYNSDITNVNFSLVDGITHNYQILYTQGCYDGAFDNANCIAKKAVSIENFLVAGVFNSRYGWFNEGSSDGPSQHLEREYVSALYNDTLPERHIGTAHKLSKIYTAPWIGLPGEWEPGAQRWVHFCSNVFGDPAMQIWTDEPSVFGTLTWTGSVNTDWNNAGNWNPQRVPTTLDNVFIPDAPNIPTIATINTTFCHNVTIESDGRLVVEAGKSIIIHGNMVIEDTE